VSASPPKDTLANIRIVLVNTFHPGNIGSVARAMKTMGLSQLYLVEPETFPSPTADTMAVGASDILQQAQCVPTLSEAIADCQLVVGTSIRARNFDLPVYSVRDCTQQIVTESQSGTVAIVFGRETMGLHDEEIQQCTWHAYIPSNPAFKSLNLAAAVQIVTYELLMAQGEGTVLSDKTTAFPSQDDMNRFYQHLEETLWDIGFIVRNHPGKAMQKIKRIFRRARPDRHELSILRGILSAAQDKAQRLEKRQE